MHRRTSRPGRSIPRAARSVTVAPDRVGRPSASGRSTIAPAAPVAFVMMFGHGYRATGGVVSATVMSNMLSASSKCPTRRSPRSRSASCRSGTVLPGRRGCHCSMRSPPSPDRRCCRWPSGSCRSPPRPSGRSPRRVARPERRAGVGPRRQVERRRRHVVHRHSEVDRRGVRRRLGAMSVAVQVTPSCRPGTCP